MGAQEIDARVLESLAAKLDGLDLGEQEALILEHVLARAAGADVEVEGFGLFYEVEMTFSGPATGTQLSDRAAGLAQAMGFNSFAVPNNFIGETEKNLRR